MDVFLVNTGLYIAYILIIVGIIMAIVFPIITSLDEPEKLKKAFVAIGILLAIYGVGYLISGSEVTAKYIEAGINTEGLSKMIGGMLTMVYILLGVSAVAITYTEIRKK